MEGRKARLEVGRIVGAHGIRGEVVVAAITDRDERFAAGSVLYAGEEPLIVRGARRHKGRWLVRFKGIADRTSAESRRGQSLSGAPLESGDETLWVHEIVGAQVVERSGTPVGRVVAVEENPAHDLLVLDTGPLVPAVFVVEHDAGRIVVDLPEGLVELFAEDG